MSARSQFSLFTTAIAVLISLSLSSCALSPEAKKKQKEQTLIKFATTVTKHLLDRNPDTITASANQLMHSEVHESALDKLQARKILPDSQIDVWRAIDDSQVAHRTNEIAVKSVKAISPLDKDDVKMLVSGDEIIKTSGKQSGVKPFNLELTCRLSDEMDNFPRLIDVNGLSANATAYGSTPSGSPKSKQRVRRRG